MQPEYPVNSSNVHSATERPDWSAVFEADRAARVLAAAAAELPE